MAHRFLDVYRILPLGQPCGVFKNPPESLCDLAASRKAQYSNDLSIDLLTYILFVVLLLQQHNGDLEVCHANNECFWGGH